MGVSFKLIGLNSTKTAKRICGNNNVGTFMAETVLRYMTPYVPMDSGMLSQNVTTEPFKLTYNVPYAKYQFNGNGFNFSKEKHPLATAHWDKATQNAKSTQIAKEVTKYIGRM